MLRYKVPDNVIVVIEGKDSKCVQSTHVSWKFAVCSPALRVQLASLVTLPISLQFKLLIFDHDKVKMTSLYFALKMQSNCCNKNSFNFENLGKCLHNLPSQRLMLKTFDN